MNDKLMILSIDDDSDFNLLLKIKLEKHKIEVRTTTNVAEFSAALREGPSPNLCIVDLNLAESPDAGFSLIQALRNKDALLPIFVMSRRSDGADIIYALELGANDYINKPLDVDLLLAKISHNLKTNILDFKNFPLLKVTNSVSSCQVKVNFKIREINEFGIVLECLNFVSKGTIVKISGAIIQEIFEEEFVSLRVSNINIDNSIGKFNTFLEFDPENQEMNSKARNWLDNHC